MLIRIRLDSGEVCGFCEIFLLSGLGIGVLRIMWVWLVLFLMINLCVVIM